ncbi:MAG: ASKHA domain-containing protein [Treponema sp.]|jgi:uncharacterized 2Fe-2S/4Fe-4S cluster protein (DUF4445 family)|nr:ASKHA domain-containing protein [Treponema sp.]
MEATAVRITVVFGGAEQILSFNPGQDENLLKALQTAGIYMPAICGGRGVCGKCRITLSAGELEPSSADLFYFSEQDLAAGLRLSCSAVPRGNISISIPRSDESSIESVSAFSMENDGGYTGPGVLPPEKVVLERRSLSYARQLEGENGGRLSLRSLRQVSSCADIAAAQAAAMSGSEAAQQEAAVYVYRDKGEIAAIRTGPATVYGIGVDIGTTTIAVALVDMSGGRVMDRVSMINKQREFGADVISRMQRAGKGELPQLSGRVRKQIAEGIAELCEKNAVRGRDICKAAIAGNTTMMHLLMGFSCATLGQYPFTPVTLDFVFCAYPELFEGDLSCEVAILPGISTYVGADITAGIFFTGMHRQTDPVLLMDIGTNGEMALMASGKLLCTATAAGPAFEGGNIQWGTGSIPGAISQVVWRDGKFAVKTIGDRPPAGICGSGVVDAVYEGLKSGHIDSSGKFNAMVPKSGIFLAKTPDGQDINFCQKDVRELQLAKSAIRSGVDALIRHAGLTCGDITRLYIAGGFGYNLNFISGVGIGLIPRELHDKVQLIGNSALGGAARYLTDPQGEETINNIVDMAGEYSLPKDSFFNEMFVENIGFDDFE